MIQPDIEASRSGWPILRNTAYGWQPLDGRVRRHASGVRAWARLLLLAGIASLTACGTVQSVSRGPQVSTTDLAFQYRLGPGDRIRLTVFNQPNLSNEFAVDESGFIATPLIGPVKGGDHTTRELEELIARELMRRGFLKDPSVSVQVIEFRPYYILGEVASPGSYPYTANLTVRKAVAAARGFTYRANTRRVYIQRVGEGIERLYELAPGTAVLPGDTIRIPERLF